MKILIIKRDKIGDLLLTTPMLAHLRACLPDAEIHLLANDYNAWVVANNSDIDKLWVYQRFKTGKRINVKAAIDLIWQNVELRREHFDVAMVANGSESPRAIQRGLSVGAKQIIAYVQNSQSCPKLTHPLQIQNDQHESDRLIQMLEPLGISPPSQPLFPTYLLPQEWHKFALSWLEKFGLAPQKYIVLGLGARRAKKQPSKEQILRWSNHFENTWGLKTVFMWTPGESDNPLYPGDDEIAQPVLDASSPHIVPFRGPIMPALGLIWNARTNIFPDSGLMHFAAISPGSVLGLFAETDISPHPSQWGPRGERATYLEAKKAVTELTDEQVYEVIESMIMQNSKAGNAVANPSLLVVT